MNKLITNSKRALIILLAACFLTACNTEARKMEKLEQKVKEDFASKTGVPCKSIKLQKEEGQENLYVATLELENGSRVELMVQGNDEQFMWKETLNSMVMNDMKARLGAECEYVKLKQANLDNYKGEVKFKTGEIINISAHPQKGWFPANEKQSLIPLIKYEAQKNSTDQIDSIDIEPISAVKYLGSFRTKSGEIHRLEVEHYGTGYKWALVQ